MHDTESHAKAPNLKKVHLKKKGRARAVQGDGPAGGVARKHEALGIHAEARGVAPHPAHLPRAAGLCDFFGRSAERAGS